MTTFVEVGAALALIRERQLYRTSHDTFEAYCRERWGWNDRRARQLIDAHEVVASLAETGTMVPKNERQARALKDVPPEHRATVLTEAREQAASEAKPVTAERIRETAHKYVPISQRKQKATTKPKPREERSGADERVESVVTAPEIAEVPPVDEQDVPTAEADAEDGPRVQPPASDSPADVVLMVVRSFALPAVPYTREDVAVAALALTQEDVARVREINGLSGALMIEYARRNTHVA
jgi:hypothetical protein